MPSVFENGGSRIQSEQSFNNYTAPSGMVGRESSGHPLANDANGSCYWADKNNMDSIWSYHDSNIADHELGFPKDWSTENGNYLRIDCEDLSSHNSRKASGYEAGANSDFTGNVADKATDEYGHIIVDPDRNNGMTSGGQPECVTDATPLSDCTVSEPQRFDDPNKLSDNLCDAADDIANAPAGNEKQLAIADWNSDVDTLKARLSGEQEYLQGRIADHEQRMSEFPEGSLEYERSKANRDWCQDYSDKLSASQEKLHDKQNELNQVAGKPPGEASPATNNSTPVAGRLPEQGSDNPPNPQYQLAGTPPDKKQELDLTKQGGQAAGTGKDMVEDAKKNTANGINAGTGIV